MNDYYNKCSQITVYIVKCVIVSYGHDQDIERQ